ncbi:MAG TPA: hypothetical protein VFF69_03150 [Phycisphaerales bacterium]|nr:hypothetical protein [Phycisphaerales bacterium]
MPSGRTQVEISWDEAPALIEAAANRLRAGPGRPVVVGVTGPVGSGKSTLASRLGGAGVSTDWYLPDYDALPEHERDEPRHASLDLLAAHLAALRRAEAIDAPQWSFHSHRREGRRRVEPAPLVVCEGLFALHREVRPLIDVGVYVDAPAALRWRRWAAQERAGARGWGVERARAYFERVAEPTFDKSASEYRGRAAFIVANRGSGPLGGGQAGERTTA